MFIKKTNGNEENLKDTHLSDFFKKIAFKKGRQADVSTTARKLGVIIWTMIIKKVPYQPPKRIPVS
jgi:transposase